MSDTDSTTDAQTSTTAATGDDDAGAGKTGDSGQGGDGQTGKTWNQADFDQMQLKEQRRAKKAAEEALAKQLGVSVKDAQDIIAAHQKREDDEKSDAQKAKEEADQARADFEAKAAAAEVETLKAQLRQALLTPGDDPEAQPPVRPDRLDVAMAVALPAAQAADDEETAIATAVEFVRSSAPEIFGISDSTGDTKPPPTPGTPGRTNGERDSKTGGKLSAGDMMLAHEKSRKSRLPGGLPGFSNDS